jgi:LCP family protein required for cell wall assembly
VHLYNGRKDAVVVSIPRDSWVEIAGCTRPDGSKTQPYKTKFNAAFAFGGPVCAIKTVEKLTDVRIDNFVVVDFKAFKTVVDAIGGVEVCLTTPAYDPVVPGRGGSGLNLPAGYSNISGEQALAFVRARESLGDGSDISRIERQQQFIGSMIRGMTEKGLLTNPQMLYRVLGAITSSIQTNPEFADVQTLQDFALSLGGLSPSRITFVTVPFEYRGTGNVYWTAETDDIWEAIRQWIINRYPDNHVDTYGAAITWGLAQAVDSQDHIDALNGRVPASLLSDGVHPNGAGYEIMFTAPVTAFMIERGY